MQTRSSVSLSELHNRYKQGSTLPLLSGTDEPDLLSEPDSLQLSSDSHRSLSFTSITSLESYQRGVFSVVPSHSITMEHHLQRSSFTNDRTRQMMAQKRHSPSSDDDDSNRSCSTFNTAFYTPHCKRSRPSRIRTCASAPRQTHHSSHSQKRTSAGSRRARCLTNGSLLKSGDESSVLCSTRGSVEDSIQYGMSLLSMSSSDSLDSAGRSVTGASSSGKSSNVSSTGSSDLDFNIYKIQSSPASYGKRKLHNNTYSIATPSNSSRDPVDCVAAKRLRLEEIHLDHRTPQISRDAFTKEYVESCRRYSSGSSSSSRPRVALQPVCASHQSRDLVGYGEQFCVQTLSASSVTCDYFKSVSNPTKGYKHVNVDDVMKPTPNPYSSQKSVSDGKSLKKRLKKIKKFLQGRSSSKSSSSTLGAFKTLAIM